MADLAQISRGSAFVLHHRGAADHLQIGDAGQAGENFILYAIGEIRVVRIAAQVFKRKHCNAFFQRGIQMRIWDTGWIKNEKCRCTENQDCGGCESDVRESRTACLRGATLQARCQFVCAGAGGWLECEHRFKQRPERGWNMRCFELFDRKHVRLLCAVNLIYAMACKWRFSCKRKPEGFA